MQPLSPLRAGVLAFVTAAVTLLAQILVHRMVSAKLLSDFAFLVISLTMLGFALSGVLLSRHLDALAARLGDVVGASAAFFALSTLGASFVLYRADSAAQWDSTQRGFLVAMLQFAPLALLYALPFAACGLILGLLLSSPGLPVRRIYFLDLMGSAAGAALAIPAIRLLGVEWAILGLCLALPLSALLLLRPSGAAVRLLAGTVAAVVLAIALRGTVFPLPYAPAGQMGLERVEWDPLARIEVTRIPPPQPGSGSFPSLIGADPALLKHITRVMSQNGYAVTWALDYDGKRESLDGLAENLYSAAYQGGTLVSPRVLVIGVGAGFDILNALYFGASEVTGVEVNAAVLRLLAEYRGSFGRFLDDPRVHLVREEGRHYLATRKEGYDVIQLSGVDSFSGTPAAAHVFSESYLYTSEAFDLYLSRLTDRGILAVMRREFVPAREMLRVLVTATAALRRAGVARPADHIVCFTQNDGLFTTMLVKRAPFTEAERATFAAWAGRSRFFGFSSLMKDNRSARTYEAFLSLDDPRKERAFVAAYPFDIAPADDDRPFFFRYSRWGHLVDGSPVIRQSVPVVEYSVIVLTAVIGLCTVLCVLLPLRHLSGAGLRAPHARRYGVFAALIGLGYMAVEIALIQKLGLFLGHPNHALSVVLAALLFATGVGALGCARIVRGLGGVRFAGYLLAVLILAAHGLVLPRLPALIGLPFAVRVALTCALIAPIGVLLGVFFPSALERLKAGAPTFVPWAWGINGIFSVLGPIWSVAVSMTWGTNALLLVGVPLYLAAGLLLPDGEEKAVTG